MRSVHTMLTSDQLRNRINYLEEETSLDPELARPEFRVLEQLSGALRAAEEEPKPTPAARDRVEEAFAAALGFVTPAMRRRGNGYISFLMTTAEEYLAPGPAA